MVLDLRIRKIPVHAVTRYDLNLSGDHSLRVLVGEPGQTLEVTEHYAGQRTGRRWPVEAVEGNQTPRQCERAARVALTQAARQVEEDTTPFAVALKALGAHHKHGVSDVSVIEIAGRIVRWVGPAEDHGTLLGQRGYIPVSYRDSLDDVAWQVERSASC